MLTQRMCACGRLRSVEDFALFVSYSIWTGD